MRERQDSEARRGQLDLGSGLRGDVGCTAKKCLLGRRSGLACAMVWRRRTPPQARESVGHAAMNRAEPHSLVEWRSIERDEQVKIRKPLNDVECGEQAIAILSDPALAEIELDAPV